MFFKRQVDILMSQKSCLRQLRTNRFHIGEVDEIKSKYISKIIIQNIKYEQKFGSSKNRNFDSVSHIYRIKRTSLIQFIIVSRLFLISLFRFLTHSRPYLSLSLSAANSHSLSSSL